jgi:serine/threonine-protein kinase
MSIATVAELLEGIRAFRLLSPSQQEKLAQLKDRFKDPQSLARKLVESGYLTIYQAKQLFERGLGAELLLGSYVILDKVGEGGMGQVFKAKNWKMNRICALKIIRKERMDKPEVVQRFYREVRAAAQLNHPNVVLAFDADEVNGTHFLATEFVDGTDLSRLVKERGPLGIEQACEYVRQAAWGLQHAHEKGMVHRDIKPSNLLVATKAQGSQTVGMVKILDMGLARCGQIDGDSVSELTQEGQVMGTPDYIAPEQMLDSRTVDIRADLYSLGCTFYYLLAGQVPFPGGSLGEKLLKHQLEYPVPVEEIRRDVPPAVAAVVARLMAKNPAERYQTPAELAAALESLRTPAGAGVGPSAAPLTDANMMPDWGAIVAGAVGPLSRPGLVGPPIHEETTTGNSSVVDAQTSRSGAVPVPGGSWDKRHLLAGIGIGAVIGLLVLGGMIAAFFYLLPAPSTRSSPTSAAANPTTEPKGPLYLSELPGSDILPGLKQFSNKGKLGFLAAQPEIKVAGQPSPNGLAMQPASNGSAQVVYELGGKFTLIEGEIAIDDSSTTGSATPLTFSIWVDKWPTPLWQSDPVQKPGVKQKFEGSLSGYHKLRLEVKCPGPNTGAHAVWIEPRLR